MGGRSTAMATQHGAPRSWSTCARIGHAATEPEHMRTKSRSSLSGGRPSSSPTTAPDPPPQPRHRRQSASSQWTWSSDTIEWKDCSSSLMQGFMIANKERSIFLNGGREEGLDRK